MSGSYAAGSLRESLEDRITEVSCLLADGRACQDPTNGSVSTPGSLENEEELLDEATELERLLHLDALERERAGYGRFPKEPD